MSALVRGQLVAVGDMQSLDLSLCVGHPRVLIRTDDGRIVTICGLSRHEATSVAHLLMHGVELAVMEVPA